MVLSREYSRMNKYRLLLAVIIGCCVSGVSSLRADDVPPFTFAKSYSADMVMTASGNTVNSKIYTDSGKVRTEMNTSGMQMVSIIRPDQQKMYSVMVAQKMVMEMPYDPAKYKQQAATTTGPQGKFELAGPDTVEGVACTKYKVTTTDGKISFMWIDAAKKFPVKMAAEDNSYSVVWKNYKEGAQDAALFEPPSDYQKMTMPSMPAPATAPAPGGSGDSGQ